MRTVRDKVTLTVEAHEGDVVTLSGFIDKSEVRYVVDSIWWRIEKSLREIYREDEGEDEEIASSVS